MGHPIREFRAADTAAVNALALTAFEQFRSEYLDWEIFSRKIGGMAVLSADGELIVAVDGERIVGAVVYVGPGKPKPEFFAPEWPILRMLVVDPAYRGRGIGRTLTEECIARARRDGAACIALHTSPIMAVALPLYLRMGFVFEREAPSLFGVSYSIYIKSL